MGLLAKLLSLLGTFWSSKFLPVYLLYKMLKKVGLLYPLIFLTWFVFVVFPSMAGMYAYMLSEGVNPATAFVGTIGVQFGGQGIEVWNALWAIPGKDPLSIAIILIGSAASVLRFLWYFYAFNWISDKVEPVISDAYTNVVAFLLLGMATIIAWFLDGYVLQSGTHFSGYTYFLSNPEIVLDPLSQFLGQASADTVNHLNNSVNNSSVGG